MAVESRVASLQRGAGREVICRRCPSREAESLELNQALTLEPERGSCRIVKEVPGLADVLINYHKVAGKVVPFCTFEGLDPNCAIGDHK